MQGGMVDLQRYRTNLGERNFIERTKAPNFFEAVLSIEVMIWSLFECWNCTVRLYVNPFQLFLSHALGKWNFLWNGKKPMWFRSKKKKKINSASKTTDRSLCFKSAVRSLKDFYLTSCISFLMKMIYYHPTSEAFDPVNLA